MSEIQIPQHYWVTEPLASLDPFRVGVIDSAATLNGLKKTAWPHITIMPFFRVIPIYAELLVRVISDNQLFRPRKHIAVNRKNL